MGGIQEERRMTKTFCDRCDREFDPKKFFELGPISFNGDRIHVDYKYALADGGKSDLCGGCLAALMIENLTPYANFKNGEPTVPPFAPPPQTPPIVNDLFCSATMQAAIDRLVREAFHHQSKLTYDQLKQAFIQALQSGDIVKHVSVAGNAQAVVYWPYRKKVELERKIEVLQSLLDRVEPATIGRDFRSKTIETLCEDIKKERQP
jgi:hypothetical protein